MNKYGAIKTEIDGHVFDSKREAVRYSELKLAERAGEISDIVLQPEYLLRVEGGKSVGKYRADFRYLHIPSDTVIVEDVKGVKTAVYRLKKRIVEAVYGIEIVEV